MEYRDYIIILYDYYGELFNDKQKRYFEDYYFSNLSLGEIAENYNVSRNAVYKQIQITINKLKEYEEKLQLFEKKTILENIINSINDKKIIEDLTKVL